MSFFASLWIYFTLPIRHSLECIACKFFLETSPESGELEFVWRRCRLASASHYTKSSVKRSTMNRRDHKKGNVEYGDTLIYLEKVLYFLFSFMLHPPILLFPCCAVSYNTSSLVMFMSLSLRFSHK